MRNFVIHLDSFVVRLPEYHKSSLTLIGKHWRQAQVRTPTSAAVSLAKLHSHFRPQFSHVKWGHVPTNKALVRS